MKKSGTVKTDLVSAASSGTPALTYKATALTTRMVKTELANNDVTSTQQGFSIVQAQSSVEVNGRTINIDAPPKPIPPLWM